MENGNYRRLIDDWDLGLVDRVGEMFEKVAGEKGKVTGLEIREVLQVLDEYETDLTEFFEKVEKKFFEK